MNIVVSDLIGRSFDAENFNCWSLAKEVFNRFEIEVKDYHIWALDFDTIKETHERDIKEWIKVEVPPVPALITMRFNRPHVNHVAVYLGMGNFIHNYQSAGVCYDSFHGLHGPMWKRMVDGFYKPGW